MNKKLEIVWYGKKGIASVYTFLRPAKEWLKSIKIYSFWAKIKYKKFERIKKFKLVIEDANPILRYFLSSLITNFEIRPFNKWVGNT